MIDESVIRFEERVIFSLRSLYRRHGYLPYKMSKFEEYELYLRNKDFLVSDRVIAFNDTNGRLMALKPDVTLSIIKAGKDRPGTTQKVYYNENVYRVSESTHRFKEIMQAGLECIGDIGPADIHEVIALAAESLSQVSDRYTLDISSMDLVCEVIGSVCDDYGFLSRAMGFISQKNAHELRELCDSYGVDEAGYRRIELLITLYGERDRVLDGLSVLGESDALTRLKELSALLKSSPLSDRIRYDFSVPGDMNYYNGFVFKGFIDGVCCSVLAGGQYDNLMRKLDRKAGAIGFAIYLDRLMDLKEVGENA